MKFTKRAFLSIKRNPGKTCLLFFVVLILGTALSGMISVNRGVVNLERNMIANMQPYAMIQFDFDAYFEENRPVDGGWQVSEAATLSSALLDEIGTLPYVRRYDYFSLYFLHAHLEKAEPELIPDERFQQSTPTFWSPWDETFGLQFTLTGVRDPNVHDIERNIIELVSGRVFTEEEVTHFSTVALVSQEFATLNHVNVGSTMTFRNVVIDFERAFLSEIEYFIEDDVFASEYYEIEIVGIFEPIGLPSTDDPVFNWTIARNMYNNIYVPISLVERARMFSALAQRELYPEIYEHLGEEELTVEDVIFWSNFFILEDPSYFPQFREAVEELTPPFYVVMDNNSAFAPILAALEAMKDLIFMVLVGTIGGSVLILTLLIILFLRDRRREVGIYRSLGEKKGKIISQFLIEIVMVSLIAVIASLFIGNIISANISREMLLEELHVQQQHIRTGGWLELWQDPFISSGIQNDSCTETILKSYDVSLHPITMILIMVIGLGTVVLGTVIPMLYVLRLNPKKIML